MYRLYRKHREHREHNQWRIVIRSLLYPRKEKMTLTLALAAAGTGTLTAVYRRYHHHRTGNRLPWPCCEVHCITVHGPGQKLSLLLHLQCAAPCSATRLRCRRTWRPIFLPCSACTSRTASPSCLAPAKTARRSYRTREQRRHQSP